jgi:hypothetical protein
MILGTWSVRRLYEASSLTTVTRDIGKYDF